MYVITDKNGVIIHLSATMGHQTNGNLLVDNGTLAIAPLLVGQVSEDVEVPEGVAPQTHTYINGTFAANPNYTDPPKSVEEQIADLAAALGVIAASIVTA